MLECQRCGNKGAFKERHRWDREIVFDQAGEVAYRSPYEEGIVFFCQKCGLEVESWIRPAGSLEKTAEGSKEAIL